MSFLSDTIAIDVEESASFILRQQSIIVISTTVNLVQKCLDSKTESGGFIKATNQECVFDVTSTKEFGERENRTIPGNLIAENN
jgi:hypothetical protein